MKKAIIRPVAKCPEGVSAADHAKAKSKGEIEVNYVTAIEALKNGKGLYELKPEPKPQVEIVGLKEPEEMSPEELVQEMTSHGKPPRKQMSRSAAEKFVRELREKAKTFIVDDE
ncbi:hypothetical protein [Ruegeria lacuscaerulensis]|uniref:hypothetical protein n=1 Tax=Ruegeria lacuscaerulensis TaxID=55218 RepID=UPI0014799858|nr:hypothetical protein [Ruegeria lacuscaerulensis]